MKKLTFLLVLTLIAATFSLAACTQKKQGENTVYTIRAEISDDFSVNAEMTVNYFNDTETEIKELKFNLFANAFREGAALAPCPAERAAEAYPNGKNYGYTQILSCRCDGEDLDFKIAGEDENILVLRLKKGVFPDERVSVDINFTVKSAECALRLGHLNGYLNLGNWFPVLCVHENTGFYECAYAAVGDPFYSQTADFNVTLTVPGEYSVAAGGECVSTVVEGNKTSYTYRAENFRDFAAVLNKDFEVATEVADGVKISLYSVGCDFAAEVVSAAKKAVNLFSSTFGKPPYDNMTIAFTEFVQGGMEYPALAYVSNKLEKNEAITATVHEIAHQWWYAAVGNNQCECAYLDEGLAEYSTLLFYEKNPEYGVTRADIVNRKTADFRAFYGVYEQLTGNADTTMERKLSAFSGEYEYAAICYVKSLLMFDGFRTGVGDARFFNGLKEFYESNKFSIAGTDELIAAFSNAGCDAEGYFDSWLNGRAIL